MTELSIGYILSIIIVNAGLIACAFLIGPKFINAALSWERVYLNWKTRRKTKAFLKTAHKKEREW